jgi:ubiquinol-cytochrome c reductase cytochrome c subunit
MRVEAPGRWRPLFTGRSRAQGSQSASGGTYSSGGAVLAGVSFAGFLIIAFLVATSGAFAAASATPSPGAASTPSFSPISSASPVASASPSPSASPSLAPDSGAGIFAANCAACHGPRGGGAAVGPSMRADAFGYIVAQKVELGGQGMPPFSGLLSPSEITTLSTYVAQDLADPQARQATIAEGGVIYRLYCGGCHGVAGRGGAIGRGRNAPSYADRPAANALAAMLRGPFNMPVFSSTLTVRQQAAVARYVYSLKPPAHPGGYGIGFTGPVGEGAIAAAGLLVLTLIAIWLAAGKGGSARE